MDIQAEKLELIQAILDIDDIGLINKIKKLIAKHSNDSFSELTAEQRQSIKKRLNQLDQSEFIPHEEAIFRHDI